MTTETAYQRVAREQRERQAAREQRMIAESRKTARKRQSPATKAQRIAWENAQSADITQGDQQ